MNENENREDETVEETLVEEASDQEKFINLLNTYRPWNY